MGYFSVFYLSCHTFATMPGRCYLPRTFFPSKPSPLAPTSFSLQMCPGMCHTLDSAVLYVPIPWCSLGFLCYLIGPQRHISCKVGCALARQVRCPTILDKGKKNSGKLQMGTSQAGLCSWLLLQLGEIYLVCNPLN